jgi:hypothetical protein
MARSSKQPSRSLTLNQEVKFEITPAPFKTFASTRHLDANSLKHAAHERIEVGYFESGCCRRLVHAVVKRGMVTKLELEPCSDGVRPTPEMSQLMQTAASKLGLRPSNSKQLPVPVQKLLTEAEALLIHVWGCFEICGFGYCVLCCYDIGVGRPWGFCQLRSVGDL